MNKKQRQQEIINTLIRYMEKGKILAVAIEHKKFMFLHIEGEKLEDVTKIFCFALSLSYTYTPKNNAHYCLMRKYSEPEAVIHEHMMEYLPEQYHGQIITAWNQNFKW